MKKNPLQSGGRHVQSILPAALAIAVAAGGICDAKRVNSEILLLVDVTGSINNTEYSRVMNSIAQSFESSSVIDSLTYGGVTSVAASLVFWGDTNDQSQAVSWMEITDLSSAQTFATAVRNAVRPFRGNADPAAALNFATPLFGDETGGVANGFESARQAISLIGDSAGPSLTALQNAATAARNAGVDEISSLTHGPGRFGTAAFLSTALNNGTPNSSDTNRTVNINNPGPQFEDTIADTASTGTTAAVPEPSSALLALLGASALVLRRRRD